MGSGWARASRTAVLLLLVGDGLRASRGPRVLVQRAVHAARVLQRADIEPASACKHLLRHGRCGRRSRLFKRRLATPLSRQAHRFPERLQASF